MQQRHSHTRRVNEHEMEIEEERERETVNVRDHWSHDIDNSANKSFYLVREVTCCLWSVCQIVSAIGDKKSTRNLFSVSYRFDFRCHPTTEHSERVFFGCYIFVFKKCLNKKKNFTRKSLFMANDVFLRFEFMFVAISRIRNKFGRCAFRLHESISECICWW